VRATTTFEGRKVHPRENPGYTYAPFNSQPQMHQTSMAAGCSPDKAGLTIWGPHTNVRRGPFLIRVARIFSAGASLGVHFLPQKVDDLFSRRYV